MGRISAVRAQLFAPDQLGDGSYLRLVQLVPQDPRGTVQTPPGCDSDDLVGRDNDVQPEVVRRLGQVLLQDLEGMAGRGDGRPVADHPRLPAQGELEVGVAPALAEPDALALERNGATPAQADGGPGMQA